MSFRPKHDGKLLAIFKGKLLALFLSCPLGQEEKMSLIFNLEERKVEFMRNSFPMNENLATEFLLKFGNKGSVELSLDTPKETEDALRSIFRFYDEFQGTNATLSVSPPKEDFDFAHGEGEWICQHWDIELCVNGVYTEYYFQRAGDGKPALNWVKDAPEEHLREEYVNFDEELAL